MSASFEPTQRTLFRRGRDHGSYDEDVINRILDASAIGHVGCSLDSLPVVTPVAYWRSGDRLFWHASSAKIIPDPRLRGGMPMPDNLESYVENASLGGVLRALAGNKG